MSSAKRRAMSFSVLADLTTIEGETLTFIDAQGNIKVDGTQGSSGFITQPDVE